MFTRKKLAEPVPAVSEGEEVVAGPVTLRGSLPQLQRSTTPPPTAQLPVVAAEPSAEAIALAPKPTMEPPPAGSELAQSAGSAEAQLGERRDSLVLGNFDEEEPDSSTEEEQEAEGDHQTDEAPSSSAAAAADAKPASKRRGFGAIFGSSRSRKGPTAGAKSQSPPPQQSYYLWAGERDDIKAACRAEMTTAQQTSLASGTHEFEEALRVAQLKVLAAMKAAKAQRKQAYNKASAPLLRQIDEHKAEMKRLEREVRTGSKTPGVAGASPPTSIDSGDPAIRSKSFPRSVTPPRARLPKPQELSQQGPSGSGSTGGGSMDEPLDFEPDSASDNESTVSASTAGRPAGENQPILERLKFCEWRLKMLRSQLTTLGLAKYFPREEGWTLRVFIEDDDMYMGAKDIGVEMVSGNVKTTTGKSGVQLSVTELELVVTVHQMRFCGPSRTAAALKRIMSPQKVSLTLAGSVLILLDFRQSRRRWRTKKASFALKIKKNISGAVTLPDAVVRTLLNSVLPQIVRQVVKSSMPVEAGYFLQHQSCSHLAFTLNVESTVPKTVWVASLFDSAAARNLLGLDQAQVLALCSVLEAGQSKRVSGLSASTLSIDRLYEYLLRYRCDSSFWSALMSVWDVRMADTFPELAGETFFRRLVSRLEELGRRPLDVRLRFQRIDVQFGVHDVMAVWSEIFLKDAQNRMKRAANNATAPKSYIKYKPPEQILEEATKLVALADKVVNLVTGSVDRANLEVGVRLHGGAILDAEFDSTNLKLIGALPKDFEFEFPAMEMTNPALNVHTHADDEGGYHAEIVWREDAAALDSAVFPKCLPGEEMGPPMGDVEAPQDWPLRLPLPDAEEDREGEAEEAQEVGGDRRSPLRDAITSVDDVYFSGDTHGSRVSHDHESDSLPPPPSASESRGYPSPPPDRPDPAGSGRAPSPLPAPSDCSGSRSLSGASSSSVGLGAGDGEVALAELERAEEEDEEAGVVVAEGEEAQVTLVRANIFLDEIDISLRKARLSVASHHLSASAKLNRELLKQRDDRAAWFVTGPSDASHALHQQLEVATTKEELDIALLIFLVPLAFDDAHALHVDLRGLAVNASTPPGFPQRLQLQVLAESEGIVTLKIDLKKILTDLLTIIEVQTRIADSEALFE